MCVVLKVQEAGSRVEGTMWQGMQEKRETGNGEQATVLFLISKSSKECR